MVEQQKLSKAHFNLKQAIQSARDIEGWLTEKEGIFLYKMANKCTGRGVIVEIGSWKGKSTIWLSLGSIPTVVHFAKKNERTGGYAAKLFCNFK